MAEQPAVNRQVLGSNPSQGAFIFIGNTEHHSLRKFSAKQMASRLINL